MTPKDTWYLAWRYVRSTRIGKPSKWEGKIPSYIYRDCRNSTWAMQAFHVLIRQCKIQSLHCRISYRKPSHVLKCQKLKRVARIYPSESWSLRSLPELHQITGPRRSMFGSSFVSDKPDTWGT